MQINDPAK